MRDIGDDDRGTGRSGTRDRAPVDTLGAIDMLGRRIGGALVLGGALIGLGLFWGGDSGDEAQRYQAFAADGEVFRVNTDSGTIIACNANRCVKILERGQELADEAGNTLFRVPPAPSAPAAQLPAPAAQQPTGSAPAAQTDEEPAQAE